MVEQQAPTTDTATPLRAGFTSGLLQRTILVVAAAVCAYIGSITAVTTVLTLVTVVVVAERAARLRRRGALDTVLVGAGGALISLALLGLVLNYLPGGITRSSWSIGAGVLGLVVLGLCARVPEPTTAMRALALRPSVNTAVSLVAAAVVLVSAVVLSVRSYDAVTVPPLQLSSAGPAVDGQLQVVVSSADAVGPLELVVVTASSTTVVDSAVTLAAGASTTRSVPVPTGVRSSIELQYPGQDLPLRQLIVDGS